MKKILLFMLTTLMANAALAWNPWTPWYATLEQAQGLAISSCKNHYGYDCVIDYCQKRYYNYAYEWRCSAKKVYYAPPPSYAPPSNYNSY